MGFKRVHCFLQVLPRSPSQLPPSALKTSKSLADAPSLARRSVSFAHETAPPVGSLSGAGPSAEDLQGVTFQLARKCYEGLTFTLDSGNDLEDWAPQYALTNIAQVPSHTSVQEMSALCMDTTVIVFCYHVLCPVLVTSGGSPCGKEEEEEELYMLQPANKSEANCRRSMQ